MENSTARRKKKKHVRIGVARIIHNWKTYNWSNTTAVCCPYWSLLWDSDEELDEFFDDWFGDIMKNEFSPTGFVPGFGALSLTTNPKVFELLKEIDLLLRKLGHRSRKFVKEEIMGRSSRGTTWIEANIKDLYLRQAFALQIANRCNEIREILISDLVKT